MRTAIIIIMLFTQGAHITKGACYSVRPCQNGLDLLLTISWINLKNEGRLKTLTF